MFIISQIELSTGIWYARFDEFYNFHTKSESAENRIRCPELRTECIKKIVRHSYLQPITDVILTGTGVQTELEKLPKISFNLQFC